MADQAEVIRQQMEDTRTSMTEKIEALEKQVTETVKDTTQTVAETVDTASETVSQTVSAISETVEAVRGTFDIPAQVDKHPWMAMGGAVALGYLVGMLLSPRRHETTAATPAPTPTPMPTPAPTPQPAMSSSSSSSTLSGGGHEQHPNFADIFGNVKELAIGTAVGVLGQVIMAALPNDLKDGVSGILSDVTRALGGKPQNLPAS